MIKGFCQLGGQLPLMKMCPFNVGGLLINSSLDSSRVGVDTGGIV